MGTSLAIQIFLFRFKPSPLSLT